MTICFYTEPPLVFALKQAPTIEQWLLEVCEKEDFQLSYLNYIFCTDDYLLKINQTYLEHDYYTDVITFDQSDSADQIEGDIFISIDRIRDNAQQFGVSFEEELGRIIVHGLLHLLGYDDKSAESKQEMRTKEETYLALIRND